MRGSEFRICKGKHRCTVDRLFLVIGLSYYTYVELTIDLLLKKMGNPRPLFVYFWSFSNKHQNVSLLP